LAAGSLALQELEAFLPGSKKSAAAMVGSSYEGGAAAGKGAFELFGR
jgi:hypothetical protein